MTGRRALAVLGLAALAAMASPAEAARVTVRVEDGRGAAARLEMCGKPRLVVQAPQRARVVVRARRRVRVERCALGRWIAAEQAGRRAVLDTTAPADLRVRSRGSGAAYVRVGVGEIADVPVSFDVVNTNTSAMSCATDGGRYVIRGRLVAPVAALGSGSATLFLHGVDAVGYMHLTQAPDVDLMSQLAARGRVTVMVDRLGYGASDRPPGDGSCLGGQADTTHQVIERLRRGEYAAEGIGPRAFQRVGLVGHSGGGPVAQITAYSYEGLAALVVMAWADQGFKPPVFEGALTGDGPKCAAAPAAYGFVFNIEAWRKYPEARLRPEVLALAEAGRSPNPCGDMVTLVAAPALDTARLGDVRVPVRLVYGVHDALFGDGAGQQDHYTGSPDVSTKVYDAGHSFFLEDAIARQAQDDLSAWLAAHGL